MSNVRSLRSVALRTLWMGCVLALGVTSASSAAAAAAKKSKGEPKTSPPAAAPAPSAPSAPVAGPPSLTPASPAPASTSSASSSVDERPFPVASASSSPRGRGLSLDRMGVALDWFSESSRMSGEQWINTFRADESFEYASKPVGVSFYLLARPSPNSRWRFGPGLRLLGNHGSEQFTFGYLSELYAMGELSLHAFEKVDVVFGARAGMALMFPAEELSAEIRRLRDESADVWNVPRLGWLGGLNVGVRRQLLGQLYGRFDLGGQLAHLWLFRTNQNVDGLAFKKNWSSHMRRMGLSFGLEVAF